jgi:FAD/FMN-containing dehydrogenase
MEEVLRTALLSQGFPPEDIQFPKTTTQAHTYNLRIPVIPTVILSPHTPHQISLAIKIAKSSFNLKVQARSGGHSYANYCLGGVDGHMVLDMKYMKEFRVDRETGNAHVGPGVRLEELAWALHDCGGRMIPQGTCGNVGLGGVYDF